MKIAFNYDFGDPVTDEAIERLVGQSFDFVGGYATCFMAERVNDTTVNIWVESDRIELEFYNEQI